MSNQRPVARSDESKASESPCAACAVRTIAMCGALEPDEMQRLTAIMTEVELGPQDTVFYEGDPAMFLYNITAGTLRLHKLLPDGRRQITGFLYPGDFVGLAVGEAYGYTAESVVAARLCRFPRDKLHALIQQTPRLETRLLGMASNELIEAQDQMLLLGRKTAREKIASFLLMLSRRAKKRGQSDNPIHLPMGRADIADFLGLTTETVSRTFTQLKTSGAIRLLENAQVLLANQASLNDMAQGG